MKNKKKTPSMLVSLLLLLSILLILFLGINFTKVEIHVWLLIATTISVIVSLCLGYTFDDLMDGMKNSLSEIMPAMMIFICIGVVIGAWIIAGTVPAIIYYGLKIITPIPQYFLPLGLLLCSVTSLTTGTSWGTLGTIGMALMGIGYGIGIPAPLTAGMIVSGAFFGDKMSPISDTTNLAPAATGSDLYAHIKAMIPATMIAYILSLIIFYIFGLNYTAQIKDLSTINLMTDSLCSAFKMNPIVFLPAIILFVLNFKKVPAVPAMLIGAFVALIIAIIYQETPLTEALQTLNSGYKSKSGLELIDDLLNRGGIQNMMWTFSLAFIAISLGGVLEKVGYLNVLVGKMVGKAVTPGKLSLIVILTAIIGSATLGLIYLSIVLVGGLYKNHFKNVGLDESHLSRLLEEGGTLIEPLIPWCTSAAFISGALQIPTVKYAPYAFFNILNPIVSVILSFMGLYVVWKDEPPVGIMSLINKLHNNNE